MSKTYNQGLRDAAAMLETTAADYDDLAALLQERIVRRSQYSGREDDFRACLQYQQNAILLQYQQNAILLRRQADRIRIKQEQEGI